MAQTDDSTAQSETVMQPEKQMLGIDALLMERATTTDHKTLALWAAECAERVLPLFEQWNPGDTRPRAAIDACRAWTRGEIRVSQARMASLAAHAAAREAVDGAARAAARAAGHAVATAHVARHALGAAMYANRAVFASAHYTGADEAVATESNWQRRRLREMRGEA